MSHSSGLPPAEERVNQNHAAMAVRSKREEAAGVGRGITQAQDSDMETSPQSPFA